MVLEGTPRAALGAPRLIAAAPALLLLLNQQPVAPPALTEREAEVVLAALRYEIAEVVAARGTRWADTTAVCVGRSDDRGDRDLPASLRARLGLRPAPHHASLCPIAEDGAHDPAGHPAIVLRVGRVVWPDDDEAHVAVSFYRTRRTSWTETLRVVRERDGWLALGPTWEHD